MIHLGGHVLAHPALQPLLVDIATLRPHPENPKNGDLEAIEESIATNGLYRPLYVTDEGTILAGNHTYAAALSLGAEQLPVLRLDVDTTQARRIMLADNRVADLGRYDDGLLLDLLAKIEDAEPDLGVTGTGYTDDDLELLRLAATTPLDLDGYASTVDLVIHGLPQTALTAFRDFSGVDDRTRFLNLLNTAIGHRL